LFPPYPSQPSPIRSCSSRARSLICNAGDDADADAGAPFSDDSLSSYRAPGRKKETPKEDHKRLAERHPDPFSPSLEFSLGIIAIYEGAMENFYDLNSKLSLCLLSLFADNHLEAGRKEALFSPARRRDSFKCQEVDAQLLPKEP